MTYDARALMLVIRKGPAYEIVLDAIVRDSTPRVCATSLAELALLLNASGDILAEITVRSLVDNLKLNVVPFTVSDWRDVLTASKTIKTLGNPRPSLGQLLAAATTARTGASLYIAGEAASAVDNRAEPT